MLNLFLKSIKHRWFEYVLAIIVVAIVVAAVTVQRSILSSTEEQIHGLAHKLGKNMLVVPIDTDLADFYAFRYGDSGMPDSHPDKINNSDLSRHISSIQSRLYGNLDLGENSFVVVGGNNASRGTVYELVPPGKAVLGETASKILGVKQFDNLTIPGKISSLQLNVENVINAPPEGLDVGIFTSLGVAQEIFDRPGEINAMRLAGCWCRIDVPDLALQVEKLLPGTKALTMKGMIKAQKGTVAAVKRYSAVIYAVAVLLIVGIVVVLISSQVRRQRREIGLLLTIGTAPWIITMFFIVTAGAVGLLGGLAGFMLGYPLTENIASSLIGASLSVQEGSLMLVLVFSSMISVVSALIPAIRAAKLDPTEILREV